MKSTFAAAVLALFLLASPIYAADAASAQQMKAQPIVEMKPGTMAVLERFVPIYYADGYQSRGSVYYATSSSAPDNIIYTRPSGNLYSFTFHPGISEKLYYANSNQRNIYMTAETGSGWSAETTIFTHTTYVRDIAFAFDQNGDIGLYFSEATGAGSDGKIYRIDTSGSAVPFYTVKLSDVEGFWRGDFAFDHDGNLYLSSGNHIPASIYKASSGTEFVTEIFQSHTGPIAGLVYRDGYLYYADWGQNIYRLDLSSMTSTVYYTNPSRTWLSDVGFRGRMDSPGSRPTVGRYMPSISTPVLVTDKLRLTTK
ncbi:MAG TPA: WD40 repeat domain-containing protein [Methanotrichaceae archaeon]|nr:WD40 repeat domain-containing protein [Methanotrichaceae archaeon]